MIFLKNILKQLGIETGDFRRPTVIVLICANLLPLYGVLFLNWDVFPILFLFWLETVVLNGVTIVKMIFSPPFTFRRWIQKLALIPYYSAHYGLMLFGLGLAVFVIFSDYPRLVTDFPSIEMVKNIFKVYQLDWAIVALLMSHGFSFFKHFIRQQEYKTVDIQDLIEEPYTRIGVMYVVVFAGGYLVLLLGSPLVALILLVFIKIVLDISGHVKQHPRLVGLSESLSPPIGI